MGNFVEWFIGNLGLIGVGLSVVIFILFVLRRKRSKGQRNYRVGKSSREVYRDKAELEFPEEESLEREESTKESPSMSAPEGRDEKEDYWEEEAPMSAPDEWLEREESTKESPPMSAPEGRDEKEDYLKAEAPMSAPEKIVENEKVEFAIFSPKVITPKSTFLLDVWAFLPCQYSYVVEIAQTIELEKILGRKGGVAIQRGAALTLQTEINGLVVLESIDSIIWDGVPTNASFIVNVPEEAKVGSYPGKVIIRFEGIMIAKIVFLIEVALQKNPEYSAQSGNAVYPKTAFASYASENRGEVLSRIQGMKKVAPDLDVFIDVFSLRSGQNWIDKLEEQVPTKDVFYLFWSQPASCSEWVEREWKIALQRRGSSYIDPVPLQAPEYAPPPIELASLHFNDAYLAYIAYEHLKKTN